MHILSRSGLLCNINVTRLLFLQTNLFDNNDVLWLRRFYSLLTVKSMHFYLVKKLMCHCLVISTEKKSRSVKEFRTWLDEEATSHQMNQRNTLLCRYWNVGVIVYIPSSVECIIFLWHFEFLWTSVNFQLNGIRYTSRYRITCRASDELVPKKAIALHFTRWFSATRGFSM